MNRIRLLPEQVANQIAAGEVVERPASVVKELVENALDARASRITVEIQAGGRSLIRVIDDGVGMSRDDALLCLERHATSKIRRAEDLAAIATMGFRGEAVPSIASVSRFTLTTRERESESPEGTRVLINGGKILEVKAAGCAPGTIVEARQLFFNLPARRKFLRSEETESAHIQHYLTLAGLAFPDVAFDFVKDGRPVWQWPAVKVSGQQTAARLEALRERLRVVYGSGARLLPVDFAADVTPEGFSSETAEIETEPPSTPQASAFRLWGFIGAPGVSRATREDQHIFVNRRPVENRGLNYALLEGYHTSLMKGRYPIACLFLEIEPAAVDVNIHPAKREVKFHREGEVRRLVAHAIRTTLLAFHAGGTSPPAAKSDVRSSKVEVPEDPARQPVFPDFPASAGATATQSRTTALQPALRMGFGPQPGAPPVPVTPAPDAAGPPTEPAPPLAANSEIGPLTVQVPEDAAAVPPDQLPAATAPAGPAIGSPVPLLAVPLRLVGVIGNLYVLLESDRGLVLLDQHAAHERILFEQMLTKLEEAGQAPSQRLLLPETVELSARDANFLRQQLQVLTRLGVGISEFGERTFLLDALPPFVKVAEPRRFVLELVDQLKAAGQAVNTLRLGEHTVAKTVCRHAVKANDPLAGAELENLVRDLRHCAMPYTCPHGRPTLIEIGYRELEKKFGRAQ